MANNEFWVTVMDRYGAESQSNKFGAVRVALLFGTAAIALALILTPMVAGRSSNDKIASSIADYDNITTGSIPKRSNSQIYTVRKSILQDNPDAICIIRSNGQEIGDC